jgi:iron complex outermembrane receptor protein
MMHMNDKALALWLLTSAALLLGTSIPVQAQSVTAQPQSFSAPAESSSPAADPPQAEPPQSVQQLQAVVVTGTRVATTVINSPVPVTVISGAQVTSTPSIGDMDNVLTALVPSLTVERQANTTSDTFIRPLSIDGLPQDEVLLLVNGIRRHLSASAEVSGTGAEGPDAATIPVLAIKNIQVLQQGASAEYGSDAIAGAINFILNDADRGVTVTAHGGIRAPGDGAEEDLGINWGMPIPILDKGYINTTLEYSSQNNTIRVGPYNSTPFTCSTYEQQDPAFEALINGNCKLQRTGQPKDQAIRASINAGLPLSDTSKLYYFGTYSHSQGWAVGSYRYPGHGQQVNGPTVRLQDGSLFSFTDMFPQGWNPTFSGLVNDWSSTFGYKNALKFGSSQFTENFDVRYGWDQITYYVDDDVNPSMGPSTPRTFEPYRDTADEWEVDADFSYTFPVPVLFSPPVLSFGAAYRNDGYQIQGGDELGDPASVEAGPYASADPWGFCSNGLATAAGAALPASDGLNCANPKDPVFSVLPAGSNSITGLPNLSTGSWTDNDKAVYAELDTFLTGRWEANLAGRFEDYASYGSNIAASFATHYQLTHWLGWRASAGTGFHAPPPGMLHQTNIQLETFNGVPVQTGLFPTYSPVSIFLGAKPLQPETAINYSTGFTLHPVPSFELTADAYLIEMFNQIYSTNDIPVTPTIAAQMTAADIPGANSIQEVFFLQNAFDSHTSGVNVVGSYTHGWDNGQVTSVIGSFNLNKYQITHVKIANGTLFPPFEVYNFENNLPLWRSVLTVQHRIGPFSGLIRANIYGPHNYETTATPFLFQHVSPDVQFDVAMSYQITDAFQATFGIQDVGNHYPQINTINSQRGLIYYDGPENWQGSLYYLNFKFSED